MKFEIFTLFPEYFVGPMTSSILQRGQKSGAIEIGVHNIRDWTTDKHHVCDDSPFGGGAGMVMKAEPLAYSVESVLGFDASQESAPCPVILMSPQGRTFNQSIAQELGEHSRIALICGHYEGIDERAIELLVTDEISIGDYVLTGGEVAASVVVDAVARLVPGVLGNEKSAQHDSFSNGLLEAPHYTRPAVWRDKEVPKVLLSGDHGAIEKWRFAQSLRRTLARRADLLKCWPGARSLSRAEQKIWNEIQAQDPTQNREENSEAEVERESSREEL